MIEELIAYYHQDTQIIIQFFIANYFESPGSTSIGYVTFWYISSL